MTLAYPSMLVSLVKVIHEPLHLYAQASFIVWEDLDDIKLGDIDIPKGINIRISIAMAHSDPSVWGSNFDSFNLVRFNMGQLFNLMASSRCRYGRLPCLFLGFAFSFLFFHRWYQCDVNAIVKT